MRTLTTAVLSIMVMVGMILLVPTGTQAQTCNMTGTNFVDLDGDGFNDNAPDHDGDGIPNGLDPDYTMNAQDGTGCQNGNGKNGSEPGLTRTQIQSKYMYIKRLQTGTASMFKKKLGEFGDMEGSGSLIRNRIGNGGEGSQTGKGTGPQGNHPVDGE
jgi:hypothetical protein